MRFDIADEEKKKAKLPHDLFLVNLIGDVCLLPIIVTTLVLILMGSDALHQAAEGKLADKIISLYPNSEAIIIKSANTDGGVK